MVDDKEDNVFVCNQYGVIYSYRESKEKTEGEEYDEFINRKREDNRET